MIPIDEPRRLDFFERNLSLWVLLCMLGGLGLGKLLPELTHSAGALGICGEASHVNVIIAILLWLMIYPMMLKVDFSADRRHCASGQRG